MLFLDTSLEELFSQDTYRPFGKGPWVCLNVACVKYRRPVVTSLTVTICCDTGKPVGTFHCECGFVFSRRGPDKTIDDRYRIGTIKEYGKVWKIKLKALVNEGKMLKDIAKELQADTATIKKYAAKLGLKVPWKLPKSENEIPRAPVRNHERELTKRKDKWLELQAVHPGKSKTELRKIAPDVYAFLYKYDWEWLINNSPIKKKSTPPNHRVDWETRDRELLNMVKAIVQVWDADQVKPTKITKTSIGKKINKLSLLEKKADKLPLTMKYICEVTETTVDFQKRRVEYIIAQLEKEGERIIEWEVYRKAGLRSTVSNEVKRFITLKMMEYETVNK